jgi:hypothetical protein
MRQGRKVVSSKAGLVVLCCVLAATAVTVVVPLEGCDRVIGLQDVTPNLQNSSVCSCTCSNPSVALQPKAISVSADDAEEDTGSAIALGRSQLSLGTNGGVTSIVGLRFPVLGIPKGAHIDSAAIQFTSAAAAAGAAGVTVSGQDADDAPAFSAGDDLSTANRPRTGATFTWPLTAPWANGEAGAPEQTAYDDAMGHHDLSPILQAIVNRPGWNPVNAIALFFEQGSGARQAFAFDGSRTKAAVLTVTYDEPLPEQDVPVCLGDDLNPDLNSKLGNPSDTELEDDCGGRVQTTLTDLAAACSYAQTCECHYQSGSIGYTQKCSTECQGQNLAADCSNFDPSHFLTGATNVASDTPVCSTHSPLAAAIFGRRSTCDVTGTATFQASDDTESTGAHGVLEFVGTPCPGQSCSVGLSYRLNINDITFGNFFESATFSHLVGAGDTMPGGELQLASDGSGALGIGSTSNSARGQRDDGRVLALAGGNTDAVDVGVDWQPGAAVGCQLSGALIGTVNPEESRCENAPFALCTSDPTVCGSDRSCTGSDNMDGTFVCQCVKVGSTGATVSLNVQGLLVNQPPTAAAGADQTVECNMANAASFTLDGSGSQDPDGDLAVFRWFNGSRVGPVVGSQPLISVTQALGTQVPYILRVIDTHGQSDESTTHASVVDTTPPTIACNAPSSITPTQAPISFTATASDICDPHPTATVTGYTCFKVAKNGVVSKVSSCVVSFKGNKVTIANSGGIDDHVQWTVSARDQSGNTSSVTCGVLVVQK